ncbi:MAG: Fe-S cluster assembly protein SufD [Proteobacteria bacterium]|nr:Fe-S cluster assembly protein SufD [Pseudomonadota bacterium]
MSDAHPERHWSESFSAAAGSRAGEPAWLEAARKSAIARFALLGFPTRSHEAWKYTNPAPIAKVAWTPAAAASVSRAALGALGLPLAEGPHLVFVNGRLAAELSSVAGLDSVVTLASHAQLLTTDPAALEPHLARTEPFDDRAFAALARAFTTDGAFVRIPRDHSLEHPIWLVLLSAPGAAPSASHPRFTVVAEASSRATIYEVHATIGAGAHLCNPLTEIRVGENAQVDHVKLQLEGDGAIHLGHGAVHVGRNARVSSTLISLGASTARHDIVALLDGPGAECVLDGLYVTRDGQHVDCRTTVDHRQPQGSSRELFKGVLSGKSRAIFNGRVIVRQGAQKTDAQQKNENLLLGIGAEVDSQPQLEIEADDVKCSHGSTIGQLEEDALFYLRSRGIGEAEAAAMLTRGFAAQITERVASVAFRERIDALVLARLFARELPA